MLHDCVERVNEIIDVVNNMERFERDEKSVEEETTKKRTYKIKYRFTGELLDHKKFKRIEEVPRHEAIIEATSEYEAIGLLYVEKVGGISITEFGEEEE